MTPQILALSLLGYAPLPALCRSLARSLLGKGSRGDSPLGLRLGGPIRQPLAGAIFPDGDDQDVRVRDYFFLARVGILAAQHTVDPDF
jgi:hypothetical protein